MKLCTTHSNVEREGLQTESQFTIKTTAKAFDILSSGLYSDKILAVIRELSCNAKDAHVAKGEQNLPFVVHLPTVLEPWFSVKDFGVGMSDEQIHDLYTTYFDSTKTTSNDYIGALGLGSKSPFSYTKSFTVIARQERCTRTYTMFVEETGIPSVAKNLEWCPLEYEGDGLEVKIAVNNTDLDAFESKTRQALEYFDPKPIFEGNAITVSSPTFGMRGNGWAVLTGSHLGKRNTIAIQGNVPYKIDINLVRDNLSAKAKKIINVMNLAVWFDIGDLEVAASREALQYDKRTVQNINNRLEQIADEVFDLIEKKIDTHVPKWQYFLDMNKLSEKLFNDTAVLHNLFSGRDLSANKKFEEYVTNKGRIFVRSITKNEFPLLDVAYYTYQRYTDRMHRSEVKGALTPKSKTIVMVNDVKVGGVSRMGAYLEATNGVEILAIRQKKVPVGYTENYDSEKEILKLRRVLGSPQVVLVSTLPKPPSRATTPKNNGSNAIYELQTKTNAYGRKTGAKWVPSSRSVSDGGIYVDLRHRQMLTSDGTKVKAGALTPDYFLSLMEIIQRFGSKELREPSQTVLYGATQRVAKQLQKQDSWFNLYEVIDQLLPSIEKYLQFSHNLSYTKMIWDVFGLVETPAFQEMIFDIKPGVFRTAFEPYVEMCRTPTIASVGHALSIFGIKTKVTAELLVEPKKLIDKYPMLRLMNRSDFLNHPTTLVDYINTIEEITHAKPNKN